MLRCSAAAARACSVERRAHPFLCSYDDNARRELSEEMGIPDCTPLRFVTTFKHEDERSLLARAVVSWCCVTAPSRCGCRCRTWGAIYSCTYDGQLKLQAEEVQAVLLMSATEIFARQHDFTGSRIALLSQSARAPSCSAQETAWWH